MWKAVGMSAMLLVGLARPVHAQPDPASIAEAERLFEDARALLNSQRDAEACDKFARSFALGHIIGAELNLGACAERDGRFAAAWRLYDAAAGDWQRAGESERARRARELADRVAVKLATIIVTLADPSIAGIAVRIGDREVPPAREIRELVDPGEVGVELSVPGRPRVRQTVQVRAGAVASIDVPAERPAASAVAPPAPPAAPRRPRVVPLALGGGAIAAAGAALLLWNHSDRTYATSRNEADDGKQRDLFHSANLQYRVAQGLGVASVACAGVAVWLYLRGGGQERAAIASTARLRIAPLRGEGRTGMLLEGWY